MPAPDRADLRSPRSTTSRTPLWLPWLAAPVFMLLPIVGCGAAASLRKPETATSSPPAIPASHVVGMMPSSR